MSQLGQKGKGKEDLEVRKGIERMEGKGNRRAGEGRKGKRKEHNELEANFWSLSIEQRIAFCKHSPSKYAHSPPPP